MSVRGMEGEKRIDGRGEVVQATAAAALLLLLLLLVLDVLCILSIPNYSHNFIAMATWVGRQKI